MKIKLNDTVKVITGKNRGKEGKVTQVLPRESMVVIDGVNKMYKYVRAQKRGDSGQRLEFFGPLAANKVMLVCPHCGKAVRVALKRQDKKTTRQCKKCHQVIE